MHFIISWDIKSQGRRWEEINDAMKRVINNYSWVHPLGTLYILKVHSKKDWIIIKENIYTIADRFHGEVNFIMSPLFAGETDYFVYQISDDDFYQSR